MPDAIIDTSNISIDISPAKYFIDSFDTKFVSFGSCFAHNMHNSLLKMGFNSYKENKSTSQFNPRNLLQLFQRWREDNFQPNYLESEFLTINHGAEKEYISPFHYHGKGKDLNHLITNLNTDDLITIEKIRKANIIFLTFGCATYLELENGIALSHAQGLSKEKYNIKILTIYELINEMELLLEIIQELNPKINIYLTISPQRYNWIFDDFLTNDALHINSDPIVQNNNDKARLRTAIECILTKFNNVSYYPSYDIVIDELRAYETFSNDISDNGHINFYATGNYVINKFLNHFCSDDIKDVLFFYRNMLEGTPYLSGTLTRLPSLERNKDIINSSIADIVPKLIKSRAYVIARKVVTLLKKHHLSVDVKLERFLMITSDSNMNREDIKDHIVNKVHVIDEIIKSNPKHEVYVYGTGVTTTLLLETSAVLIMKTKSFINTEPSDMTFFSKKILRLKDIKNTSKVIFIIGSAAAAEPMINNIKKCIPTADIVNIF